MFVNLTPHAITFVASSGNITIPPCGTVARVAEEIQEIGVAMVNTPGFDDGQFVPLVRKTFGDVEGLPAPAPTIQYLVSAIVKSAVPDRLDVFVPTDFVRDEAGRIIGARAIAG